MCREKPQFLLFGRANGVIQLRCSSKSFHLLCCLTPLLWPQGQLKLSLKAVIFASLTWYISKNFNVYLLVKQTESFSFVNIRLSDFFIQKFPPSSKFLGDFSIVFVRISFDNFPPFQLGPDHKGVHRPFNMIDWMFFCLKKSRKKYLLKYIHYNNCLAQQNNVNQWRLRDLYFLLFHHKIAGANVWNEPTPPSGFSRSLMSYVH